MIVEFSIFNGWCACMYVVWMDVKCLNSSHFLLKFSWEVNSWMKQKSHCKVCKSVIVKVKKSFVTTLKSQWQCYNTVLTVKSLRILTPTGVIQKLLHFLNSTDCAQFLKRLLEIHWIRRGVEKLQMI